ncbi:uncharacterized protein TERG_12114 [Trichophyton rubrum CBS 118892]|uniref:Uncharacterized protein n=1 Tax=Trichophyton rubrum (strain ATCC MYA-4607 / CBS 118892) TaxID=559305 RepID=A0A080WJ62_TRIRC|nr:uncharacterized protein TERG_12114 [Trichophyton rubrum CBS 118892]KFL61499.1 hypothetical protein TERG_12114 [Trichophyton rubrum CBS 118892]
MESTYGVRCLQDSGRAREKESTHPPGLPVRREGRAEETANLKQGTVHAGVIAAGARQGVNLMLSQPAVSPLFSPARTWGYLRNNRSQAMGLTQEKAAGTKGENERKALRATDSIPSHV